MLRLLAALLLVATLSAAPRPNIIVFFVDDLGYGDIGCFWQDARAAAKTFDTPALDRMAAEGAKLTHHYISASVCAPSRASLLQGRHQGHCDIRNSQFDKVLPDNHTIASVLKAAGYRTIHIGKNGLAGAEGSTSLTGTGSRNLGGHPLDRGFDRFFGYLFHQDGHEHYPRNGTSDKQAYIYDDYRQVIDASADLYTTDAWTAAAKKEIIDEASDGDDQPFFLYLAYDTPHFKMQRPAVAYPPLDRDGDPLTGGIQWTPGTDGSGKVRYASTADGTGAIDGYTHPDIPGSWANSEKQHVGMIRRIDESVADILRTLEDLGIDGETLCVFSSDNGPHNEGNNPRTFESFADMEGIKRDMWEAGIRVPTIVRWPGHLAGATGSEADIHEIGYPSAIWDWMPTFCELAGVPAPAWCDGVSIAPTLTGNGTQRDKDYLYFEFQSGGSTPAWGEFPHHGGDAKGQMQCLRIGDHMGIRTAISSGTENFRIYDVTRDPGQATDLAGSLPELQSRMQYLARAARRPGGGVSRPYDSLPLPAVAPGPLAPGVDWRSYADPEASWQWVPEFRDLAASASGVATTIDLSVRPGDDHFGLLFTGYLKIPAAGNYRFQLDSDTGADFFLHDGHLIDEDFRHSGSATSPAVALEAGLHPFRLYYRHTTGPRSLGLQWTGPGIPLEPVPASALFSATPPELSAIDDHAATQTDEPVLVDVLANDLDDGLPAPLSIVGAGSPDFGTASVVEGGILFTPPAAFEGTARFSYTITDGEGSDSADVTVTVRPYSPPVARRDLAHCPPSTTVDIAVLDNDLDDGLPSPLGITTISTPAVGGVENLGSAIRYTAPAGFDAPTTFRYTVDDGGGSESLAEVTVVPVAGSAWWLPFDEESASVALDVGGKQADLLGFGTAPRPDGCFGRALRFSGEGESVRLTGFKGILGSDDRTVSAWIRSTATGQHPIIAWGPNAAGQKWTFLMQNGHLRLEVTSGFREGTTILNDGEWHHVACTFADDGTPNASDLRLFVDGVEETNFAASSNQSIQTTASIDVRVGSDVQDRHFVGDIDDARVLPEALTPGQLLELAGETASVHDRSLWYQGFFGEAPPSDLAWDLDDDRDRFTVFQEYALGGSPHARDPAIAPFLELRGLLLEFVFNRRIQGIDPGSYLPEATGNPATGDWLALPPGTAAPHPDLPGYERIRVGVDRSPPRRFVRLRIER